MDWLSRVDSGRDMDLREGSCSIVNQTDSDANVGLPVGLADLEAAARRIAGFAVRTPLLESAALNERVGGRVLIKCECLQRTGSFKFRGAFNKLSQLNADQRRAGVVAWSSGNHAQGVAAAAQLLGIHAAIVMPQDAPQIKIDNTRAYGAEVVLYDRHTASREEIGRLLAVDRGAIVVPSYDDQDIIAGQGTAGLEMVEQARRLDCELDHVLVCCSGGGLTAGIATAFHACSPHTKVHTVEPEGFDDYARSLRLGHRVPIAGDVETICDALRVPEPGELTFAVNSELCGEGLVVSDQQARDAIRYAFRELKLVVEPGGAVALAAVLAGQLELRGRSVAVVLSGGNVDPLTYCEAIQ